MEEVVVMDFDGGEGGGYYGFNGGDEDGGDFGVGCCRGGEGRGEEGDGGGEGYCVLEKEEVEDLLEV